MSEPWITEKVMRKIRQELEDYDPTTPDHLEAAANMAKWDEMDRPGAPTIRSTDLRQWAKDQVAKESVTEQDDRRG